MVPPEVQLPATSCTERAWRAARVAFLNMKPRVAGPSSHRYPAELVEALKHRGRDLVLRPIRPEDAQQHHRFMSLERPEDLYFRFFAGVHELPEADVVHFTHIDYDREMAFVAVQRNELGDEEIVGVARACADAEKVAEFAVIVRSDLKGQGIGKLLMQKLIRYCRERGLRELWGSILLENVPMRHLAQALGFKVRGTEGNVEEVVLELQLPRPSLVQIHSPTIRRPPVS